MIFLNQIISPELFGVFGVATKREAELKSGDKTYVAIEDDDEMMVMVLMMILIELVLRTPFLIWDVLVLDGRSSIFLECTLHDTIIQCPRIFPFEDLDRLKIA